MRTRILFALPVLALLAACGPDGSDSGSGTPSGQTASMLELVNAERAADGQAPVRLNARLSEAAQGHAEDMIANNFFSHTSSNGDTLSDRVAETGYTACYASENIAFGQRDEEEVMEAWMNSDGHRRNILAEQPEDFGFARVDSSRGIHWVQVFGRSC